MVRWQPDAHGRLQQAAMELYVERGFDQVTVADIAERAGLTERTFFRYFADKREVLFAGSSALQDRLGGSLPAPPPPPPPPTSLPSTCSRWPSTTWPPASSARACSTPASASRWSSRTAVCRSGS